MQEIEALENIFNKFAAFGARRNGRTVDEFEIDATRVVKLARDCKVLDKRLNRNQVDLCFQKVKKPSKRKLNFDEFVRCTELWAREKGISHAQLLKQMVSNDSGPQLSGTVPDAVAFHDNKSRYTGTHKNGGPESVAKGGVGGNDLSKLLDRSPANVRGIKKNEPGNLRQFKFHSDDSIRRAKEEKQDKHDLLTPLNEDQYDWKIRVEGKDYMLHPDWEKRVNLRSVGTHDKHYYVNQVTNERSWSIPTVPVNPPEDEEELVL